jgi:hypothetical protein
LRTVHSTVQKSGESDVACHMMEVVVEDFLRYSTINTGTIETHRTGTNKLPKNLLFITGMPIMPNLLVDYTGSTVPLVPALNFVRSFLL